MENLLQDKVAVIYGAAGGIGSGVARRFAAEGARVVLTGRTRSTLAALADELGPPAEFAVVDALDEAAVDAHAREVGRIDVSFNLIGRGDVQGRPLIELSTSELLTAVENGLRSSFLTARAAARAMTAQGSGVILHLNSASGAGAAPGMGSTGPADAAVEAFMRYLAAEVGRSGVRVCGLWTAGVEETLTAAKLAAVGGAGGPTPEQAIEMISRMSVLGRVPRLADVANVAAFLASDRAGGITGSMTNVTAGLVLR
jgi:NAD(P)-dependent dehydrogenase (short-subunit alcohol dehydrogenase family)